MKDTVFIANEYEVVRDKNIMSFVQSFDCMNIKLKKQKWGYLLIILLYKKCLKQTHVDVLHKSLLYIYSILRLSLKNAESSL